MNAPVAITDLLTSQEDLELRYEAALEAVLTGALTSPEAALSKLQEALAQVFTQLKRPRSVPRGRYEEIWSLCPFHRDHNVGSFSVNTSFGSFYCFVCGARGGPIRLLKHFDLWDKAMRERLKDINFTELMKHLRSGWDRDENELMDPIPEQTIAPYRKYRPRRYVLRGHPRHILDEYEVCYDPDHQRIIFPVRKATGELVGLQSRLACNSDPRIRWKWYRFEMLDVCPELFDLASFDEWRPPRRTVFWGENYTFPGILSGEVDEVVLVEGMGAALRTVASGYSVLASFGTRLGPSQAMRLRACAEVFARVTGRRLRIILGQDGDDPGRAAAVEAFNLLAPCADVLYAPMPSGKDPEEFSPANLRKIWAHAGSLDHLKQIGHAGCARGFERAMLDRIVPHIKRQTMRRPHVSQP